MSKYIKLEDIEGAFAECVIASNREVAEEVIRLFRTIKRRIADLPTLEVSEGIIGQGSGDIDWQAVTSTGQEIYAKGYEDGRKSVEVSEDCISRKWLEEHKEVVSHTDEWGEIEINEYICWEDVENAPSVIPKPKEGEWIYIDEPIVGNPYGRYRCSECELEEPHKTDFCPNCGTRMEIEK